MTVKILMQGTVNGGLFYAVETGAELAELQSFANSKKNADYTAAKLGNVTAYDGETVKGTAEIILVHGSDVNAAKTMMVSAQAKVRAHLTGKVGGKRGGRELM